MVLTVLVLLITFLHIFYFENHNAKWSEYMKIKLTNKDIIWSYIGTILSMASNLIMLPFIVYFLDEDMLGLWYVFSSVGAIATLFDFGFAVTFSRNITYCWSGAKELKAEGVIFSDNGEPNYVLMKSLLITCKRIYFLISGIALLLMISVGTVYIAYISREVKGVIHIVAWFIYSISVFLNLYYGYYSSLLRGVGAVTFANINTIIAKAIQIFVTIILLLFGMGIVGVCFAYSLYGMIFRMLGKEKFFSYKKIGENLKKVKTEPTKKEIHSLFRIVWHNAWKDSIVGLSSYLSEQASTVICSLYLSLAETGVYSLSVQIATAVANIASTLYSAYQPELQAAYIENNRVKLKKLMSLIIFSFVSLFLVGTIGVAIIGLPLLRIIKGSANISLSIFCV